MEPKRKPDRVEAFLNMIMLINAVIIIGTPIIAIVNYPQGVIMEPIMFMEKLYVFIFGVVMLLIEMPHGLVSWATNFQIIVSRSCSLLTTLVGKGLFLIFVGCNCFNVLNPNAQSMLLQTLIAMVGCATASCGGAFLWFGGRKVYAVNAVRSKLKTYEHNGRPILPPIEVTPRERGLLEVLQQSQVLNQFLEGFATSKPGQIGKEEFNVLCRKVMDQPKFTWSEWDLELIFDGLFPAAMHGVNELGQLVAAPKATFVTFQNVYDWLASAGPLLI